MLQKLEADIARWRDEIPADQATAEQLGAQLEEAEQKLEQLQDGIKGEVESHHQQLTKVQTIMQITIVIEKHPPAAAILPSAMCSI